jgi:hypothetical protein
LIVDMILKTDMTHHMALVTEAKACVCVVCFCCCGHPVA